MWHVHRAVQISWPKPPNTRTSCLPQRRQPVQGMYVIVLPVSTMTLWRLGGLPKLRTV